MRTINKRYTVVETRPARLSIPARWKVYNAPRPLLGDVTWQGEFCKGIFYAAVDPDGENAGRWIEVNRRMDADEVVTLSREAFRRVAIEDIEAHYGIDRCNEIGLYNDDHVEWLVNRGLDLMNRPDTD
jgi:hypothetical protein